MLTEREVREKAGDSVDTDRVSAPGAGWTRRPQVGRRDGRGLDVYEKGPQEEVGQGASSHG